ICGVVRLVNHREIVLEALRFFERRTVVSLRRLLQSSNLFAPRTFDELLKLRGNARLPGNGLRFHDFLDGQFKSGHMRSLQNRPTGVGPRHAWITPLSPLPSSPPSSCASFAAQT